jgi:hypothetical protein
MKSLLTAADPGDADTVGGTIHALSREGVTCHRCGALGLQRNALAQWSVC